MRSAKRAEARRYDSDGMPENLPSVTHRTRFFRDAFLRPAGALVAIPYTAWGLLAFIRDEILQPADVTMWKPIFWLSKLPWYVWLIATLTVALLVMFEGAYRVVTRNRAALADAIAATLPRVSVLPRHHASVAHYVTADHNQSPTEDVYRIVVSNAGSTPVEDLRIFVHGVDGYEFPAVPLGVTHQTTDPRDTTAVRLFQDNPIAFKFLEYSFDDGLITIAGSRRLEKLNNAPFSVDVTIVGANMATLREKFAIFWTDIGEPPSVALILADGSEIPLGECLHHDEHAS